MKGRLLGTGRIAAAIVAALVALPRTTTAQDFPGYKGDPQRTGKAANANSFGPGRALLRWFRPTIVGDNAGRSIVLDNTYTPSPVTDPAYTTAVGTWTGPATADEASFPFLPDTNNLPPGVLSPGGASYLYSEAVASATGTDPRLSLSGTPDTYTWNLRNYATPFYEARNYALYAWIPTGPTTIAGSPRPPQRFFVYEIVYAGGTYVDVVDIESRGGGWVRLGANLTTNALFPADGVAPLLVRLYNTVPRDPSTGVLTTNADPLGGDDLDPGQPRPLVYADAVMAVPQTGSYAATPIVGEIPAGAGTEIRTVGAKNEMSIAFSGGELTTLNKGVVTSYTHTDGTTRWTFSPLDEGANAINVDNTSSSVTTTGGAWVSDTVVAGYRGTDYFSAPIVNVLGTESTVEYQPLLPSGSALDPGTYEIYAWLPGDVTFPVELRYEIHEGSTVTPINVDQSLPRGWVKIGTRRFTHSNIAGEELKLVVTNYSANALDVGKTAFTDAIRFVGENNLTVLSTPIQATARVRMTRFAAPVDQPVVIVAAEDGKIYCLDAEGRGDGTTDILWTYPSTRDSDVPLPPPASPDTWLDPNLNPPDAINTDWEQIDGTANQRIAEMPTGFGLSSPTLVRIAGEDYVFVAASNGRIYCIEVAGRGDMDLAQRKPGTTRRVWSYPDDFPATPVASAFGGFVGSVAVATVGANTTVFVPTMQGRMYALDAVGTPATRTTTTRWTFPALTDANLGPMAMTPSVEFDKVFVGTRSKDFDAPGQFFALDAATGALSWSMAPGVRPFDDFNGGPATASATVLDYDLAGDKFDSVFVSNDNGGVYALKASDGALLWETYELGAAAVAPLAYTTLRVPANDGLTLIDRPTVVVPKSDGRIGMLFATPEMSNVAGNRRARGDILTESNNLTAGVAIGQNYMYYADNAGFIYARNDVGSAFPGEDIPGGDETGENDPGYANYSDARIKLITRAAFQQLRQGTMYYATADSNAIDLPRDPLAFEWGETIYLLVYNYSYRQTGTSLPPVVNVSMSVTGQSLRNLFGESRRFPDAAFVPPGDLPPAKSGYAVMSFTFQQAGPNSLPPGPGEMSVSFNTTDASGNPISQPAAQRRVFYIANPLGLVIPSIAGFPFQLIGALTPVGGQRFTTVTNDPENLENGSSTVPNLRASAGSVAHGQTGNAQVGVVDRSKMVLVRVNRGLGNIRILRSDLAYQVGVAPAPGVGAPWKPIDSLLFPGFEDLPVNYPNISLDYPDLGRERVTMTGNLLGAVQNPILYAMDLIPPIANDGSPIVEANADAREARITPVDVNIDVPRFQPMNELVALDAQSNSVGAGYSGTYVVYVDSTGDGQFNRTSGFVQSDPNEAGTSREAYRTFQLSTAIAQDERFTVLTPVLDLGSLASGAGYSPLAPGPGNATFDPWTGTYQPLFKEFRLANEGNVNLLNLRLAKYTTSDGVVLNPWRIFSNVNENLAYVDADFDVWSDLDAPYAPARELTPALLPSLDAPVILQKSRVGDRFPRELTTNPVRRVNPNIGVALEEPRFDPNLYPVRAPRVAVSVPFGYPSGTHSRTLRIIEDDVPGSAPASMALNVDVNNQPTESLSDPGLQVVFKVRESRLTNSFSNLAAPMLDSNLVSGVEAFRYSNLQPTGFRHATNGSLVMAWASNRPDWAATVPAAVPSTPWRIFIGSVDGSDPTNAAGTSPLRDLNAFTPDTANGQWFIESLDTATGFPLVAPDTIFNTGGVALNNVVLPETVRFGSPVFPIQGMLDPFRNLYSGGPAAPFTDALMAFVGETQIQAASGRTGQSKIFVTNVSVAADGAVGIGDIIAMTNDPQAAKGRPSIVQMAGGDYILFYSATVAGKSALYWVKPSGDLTGGLYDGSRFGESQSIDLGEGFESAWSPTVTGRLYRGANLGANPPTPQLEILFTGKLRGRPVNEVFYGRMGMDPSSAPTQIELLPIRSQERLVSAGEAGTYRAQGVQWDRASGILIELLRAGVYTDIEVPGSRQVDRATGIVTIRTRLGGTAYIDPGMGSIRLVGGQPTPGSSLHATYRPRLLRVSEGTAAGYASPSLLFDERLVPDPSYWLDENEADIDAADNTRTARYTFMYGRAAAGAGQASRPFMKTMRLGVELDLPVYTESDGSLPTDPADLFEVSGNVSYIQIDPAKGKVYFTTADEDQVVTITYRAADRATGQPLPGARTVKTATVGMIVERPEEAVILDEAANETNLFAFLDPFDLPGAFDNAADATVPIDRRPGLIWLFWASTRAGAPDLYFQTIAPRYTPLPIGN